MNIFLDDPHVARLPPEEVRLREVIITPQADGKRVKIYLELTPFQKRPNISVSIFTASGGEAAQSTILETMLPKLEFTVHIRESQAGSEYKAEIKVYYQGLPTPTNDETEVQLPTPLMVDNRTMSFILPNAKA